MFNHIVEAFKNNFVPVQFKNVSTKSHEHNDMKDSWLCINKVLYYIKISIVVSKSRSYNRKIKKNLPRALVYVANVYASMETLEGNVGKFQYEKLVITR